MHSATWYLKFTTSNKFCWSKSIRFAHRFSQLVRLEWGLALLLNEKRLFFSVTFSTLEQSTTNVIPLSGVAFPPFGETEVKTLKGKWLLDVLLISTVCLHQDTESWSPSEMSSYSVCSALHLPTAPLVSGQSSALNRVLFQTQPVFTNDCDCKYVFKTVRSDCYIPCLLCTYVNVEEEEKKELWQHTFYLKLDDWFWLHSKKDK